jgi:hypothetical protein
MATDKCPEYFRRNRMVTAGFVMQALAAEFSGFRRKTPLLFAEKNIKTVCLDSSIFENHRTEATMIRCFDLSAF